MAEIAYCDLVLSGTVTEEALISAAQNYADHVKESGDRMIFPHNFLEKRVFEDYLEVKPAEVPQEGAKEPEPEEDLVGEDEDWWKHGPNGWEE